MDRRRMPISGEQLRNAYLSPAMLHYFRKKLRNLTETEVCVRIEETLKFLAIANYCSGPIPVSKEIDEVWHYWILQTQEYVALCLSLPGEKFLHHTSNDYIKYFYDDIDKRDNLQFDVNMLATYVENYGPFEKNRTKYWILASHLIDQCGWKIQQLNDWLTSRRRAEEGRPAAEGEPARTGEMALLQKPPGPQDVA